MTKYVITEVKLPAIIEKAFIMEKTVKKFGITSGVIYVPKGFIGKKFRLILLPIDDEIKFD